MIQHLRTAFLPWGFSLDSIETITYLVHGEPAASSQLRLAMTSALRWKVEIAQWLQKVEVR